MSLDEKTKNEILEAVSRYALDQELVVPLVATEPGTLLNRASGIPRWNSSAVKKFTLIYEMPEPFASMEDTIASEARILCCLCRKLIKYPCWYYVNKYVRNEFHYFVCSSIPDGIKDDRVTVKCLAKKGWRIK